MIGLRHSGFRAASRNHKLCQVLGNRSPAGVLPSPRWLSTPRRGRSTPAFRIPAHVATYSLLLIPPLLYLAYMGKYGPSEEEMGETLEERYHHEIATAREKNKRMADFFQHAIHNPDGQVDKQLDEVLHAGKGVASKKRLHAVDERLYGTAEGVAEKERMEEEIRKERKKKKRRKKKLKEEDGQPLAVVAKEADIAPKAEIPGATVSVSSVATVAAVATLAALVGYAAGGRKS